MKFFSTFALLLLFHTGFSQQWHFPNVDFSKADSIALSYQGQSLKDPDALAKLLVRDLHTEPEKFRAIFRWISDNIAYDYAVYQKIIDKERKMKIKKKKI